MVSTYAWMRVWPRFGALGVSKKWSPRPVCTSLAHSWSSALAWLPQSSGCSDSGLALDNGVIVDEFCESSVPGVFAAGDVANWPYTRLATCQECSLRAMWNGLQQAGDTSPVRVRLEHWDNALRQSEVAARNLLGQRTPFAPVPYFWSDQYNLRLQYVGHAVTWDQLLFRGTPGGDSWIAFYLQAGHIAAALAVNRVRDLVPLKKLVGMAVRTGGVGR